MEKLRVKASDCSSDRLCRIAEQAGFRIEQGKKHCKVKTFEGTFVTTIPRHATLKRELVKGVVKALNANGADIDLQ